MYCRLNLLLISLSALLREVRQRISVPQSLLVDIRPVVFWAYILPMLSGLFQNNIHNLQTWRSFEIGFAVLSASSAIFAVDSRL